MSDLSPAKAFQSQSLHIWVWGAAVCLEPRRSGPAGSAGIRRASGPSKMGLSQGACLLQQLDPMTVRRTIFQKATFSWVGPKEQGDCSPVNPGAPPRFPLPARQGFTPVGVDRTACEERAGLGTVVCQHGSGFPGLGLPAGPASDSTQQRHPCPVALSGPVTAPRDKASMIPESLKGQEAPVCMPEPWGALLSWPWPQGV